MRKFLLLTGALAVVVAAQASTPRTAEDAAKRSQQRYELAKKGPRYAAEQGKWCPGTIATYSWNSWETNDWQLVYEMKYTYDDRGRVLEMKTADQTHSYEYDNNGHVTSQTTINTDGSGNKTEYGYDEVTGKCIRETSYYIGDGEDVLSSEWELKITRDSKGNITRIDDYSMNYDTKEIELSGYRVYTYGNDGKISEIVNYDIDENQPVVEFHLKDIVWENTNGQLIVDDTNDMDADDYCMGENRVKSGTLVDFDGDEGVTALVNVEYTGNEGNLKMSMTINGTEFYNYKLNVIDANGSYSEDLREVDYEVEGSTVTFGDVYTEIYSEVYDFYGILTKYESKSTSPDYSSESTRIGDVTYDSTHGYPTEVTYKYSNNGEEMTNDSRMVYSDYKFYSGLANITVDENAPVEYYNLQGVRVANPSNGIYIRRQGSKAVKVMVK